MIRPFIVFVTGLTAAAILTGCGKGGVAPLAAPHPVHGKIKFPNGTPLRGGIIYFTPREVEVGGQFRYEAAALIDAHGSYKLGYNGDGTGAPTGEYKVTIMPRDYQELDNSNSNWIPPPYHDKKSTPLTVQVHEGDNVFDFELK